MNRSLTHTRSIHSGRAIIQVHSGDAIIANIDSPDSLDWFEIHFIEPVSPVQASQIASFCLTRCTEGIPLMKEQRRDSFGY